jgi:hypothetical protein
MKLPLPLWERVGVRGQIRLRYKCVVSISGELGLLADNLFYYRQKIKELLEIKNQRG